MSVEMEKPVCREGCGESPFFPTHPGKRSRLWADLEGAAGVVPVRLPIYGKLTPNTLKRHPACLVPRLSPRVTSMFLARELRLGYGRVPAYVRRKRLPCAAHTEAVAWSGTHFLDEMGLR